MRVAFLAPLFLALLTTILPLRGARAGCPNLCDIYVAPAKARPALPKCVALTAYGADCDCQLLLTLKNQCDVPLRVVDYSFYACTNDDGGVVKPCSTLDPGFEATAQIPFARENGTGIKPTQLHLQLSNIDYTIDIQTDVREFRSTGCAIGEGVRPWGGHAVMSLLMVMLVLWRARRTSAIRYSDG